MKKKIVIINTIITVIALILMFALGIIENAVKKKKLDSTNAFQCLPITITQVLDSSVDITIDQCHFKDLSQFLSTVDAVPPRNTI